MSRDLPFTATADDYQRAANALLASLRAGDDAAAWHVKWEHPRFKDKTAGDVRAAQLDLADAQLVVARSHGFETWADLVAFAAAVAAPGDIARFETAADAVVDGDLEGLRFLLHAHPELVHARSVRRHHATLLHYLGANGVEGVRQKTPPNAVEIAKALLAAGAEVDALADMYDARCTTMSMLARYDLRRDPLDWALHGGRSELAEYLRSRS